MILKYSKRSKDKDRTWIEHVTLGSAIPRSTAELSILMTVVVVESNYAISVYMSYKMRGAEAEKRTRRQGR